MYGVFLSNQKSIFTQPTVTFICCKTDLNVGSKTRNMLFNTFCSNLGKQVALVCYPFYRSLNYYINTNENEIPGELSRENLISSHVKISPLLWLHNKSRLSHEKTIKVKWFGISLVFTHVNFTCVRTKKLRNGGNQPLSPSQFCQFC